MSGSDWPEDPTDPRCPACGEPVSATARFCMHCDASLPSAGGDEIGGIEPHEAASDSTTTDTSPLGVKLVCVLLAPVVVVHLLAGLVIAVVLDGPLDPATLRLIGVFVLAVALLYVPALYGLWSVEPWAWTLAMLLLGVGVLFYAVVAVLFYVEFAVLNPIAIVPAVVALFVSLYVYTKGDVYGGWFGLAELRDRFVERFVM